MVTVIVSCDLHSRFGCQRRCAHRLFVFHDLSCVYVVRARQVVFSRGILLATDTSLTLFRFESDRGRSRD